ncbi:Aste57867_21927 [Aphanomyces stellatus]|uniref:Aste57867_21927 protein n=1 Tax=Aphanomyces stellatus TaxID=120398 RepID=A0A485LNP6_9STRA|nr:hypothetical protein As57867_021858 [Aphanomyces stellatus]VFT98595.1 Aste57867_21927 [Aphanomyces stellatus]
MNPQQATHGGVQYAGYSQFYASSTPAARPPAFRPPLVQGQQQYAFQNPHQAYQYAPPPRPPFQVPGAPPRGYVPAPRPIPAAVTSGSRWDKFPPATSSIPVASNPPSNQWQWNTGKAAPAKPAPPTKYGPAVTVASAPPRPYTPSSSKFHDAPTPAPPSKFQNHPTPVSTTPTPAAPAAGQWPASLKAYVERAFAKCRSDADKSIVQSILKEKISAAMTANNLWTKNWDVEALPLSGTASMPPTVAPPQGAPRAVPSMRPPPPPPATMAFPRPPMMPLAVPAAKPSPFSDSFIPLDMKKAGKNKGTKRKPDADDGTEGLHKKMQRQQRFLKDSFNANTFRTPTQSGPLQVLNDEGELDLDAMIIKGTCLKVEKDYLRLTSAPHPSAVRPEHILKKALELVRKKWKEGTCDYLYVVSQMKSIRQDCTVQHIKNDFTVLVYETHARIALEEGDMNEFNQCQTQLRQLYEQDIAGNRTEFLAYRILYCIYVCLQGKTDNSGNVGMYRALSMVSPADRKDTTVRHALSVREAVFANDYRSFFKLYAAPPKMSGYLMDSYANHMRLQALKTMCKAYQPSIPIEYVKTHLLLEGKEGQSFIKECGIQFVGGVKGPRDAVDCKASEIVSVLKSSAKSLL